MLRITTLSSRFVSRPGRLLRGGNVHFYEPSGYFLNQKPGTKRTKEWWENIYVYGVGGGFLFAAVGLYFKPDTRVTTWARKEAERRLIESGELTREDLEHRA